MFLIGLGFLFIFIPNVYALTCGFNVSGVELFSVYRSNNTHIAMPEYYATNFSCDVTSATVREPSNWWGEWYQYRRNITIDNSQNTNSLTNYAVQVNITYDSGMQTDFDDLRFIDSDDSTELNYYIEKNVSSEYTMVWINVSISGSSTKDIFMYYGYSDASSASDGDSTFTYFNDSVTTSFETSQTFSGNLSVGSSMKNGSIKYWFSSGSNYYGSALSGLRDLTAFTDSGRSHISIDFLDTYESFGFTKNSTDINATYSEDNTDTSYPTDFASSLIVNFTSLTEGLVNYGTNAPTMFNMSGTIYLISGKGGGTFAGYDWNWVEWETNDTIVSNLGDLGDYVRPEVFELDGLWHLISGENNPAINGFTWNGTDWVVNSTIIAGLPTNHQIVEVTVFEMDGLTHLIWGEYEGTFTGYTWGGSSWVSNSTIVSGLPDVGFWSSPEVFLMDNDYFFISGAHGGATSWGRKWNTGTSQWDVNNTIICGINKDWGSYASPNVLEKDNHLYLIIGEYSKLIGREWNDTCWVEKDALVNALWVRNYSYPDPSTSVSASEESVPAICQSDEKAWFSLYHPNNIHIGHSNYYPPYQLCVEPKYDCYINSTGNCADDETEIFSLYRENNTHIGEIDYYDNAFCCKLTPAGEDYYRVMSQGFVFVEFNARSVDFVRDEEVVFDFGEDPERYIEFTRPLQQVFDLSDDPNRYVDFTRTNGQTFQFSDDPNRYVYFVRTDNQTFDFSDSVYRIFEGVRTAEDSWNFVDSPERHLDFVRDQETVFGIDDETGREVQFNRLLQQVFGFEDDPDRIVDYIRTESDLFTFVDSIARRVDFYRTAEQAFDISDLIAHYIGAAFPTPPIFTDCIVPYYVAFRDIPEAVDFCYTYYNLYSTEVECLNYCLLVHDDTKLCSIFCALSQ